MQYIDTAYINICIVSQWFISYIKTQHLRFVKWFRKLSKNMVTMVHVNIHIYIPALKRTVKIVLPGKQCLEILALSCAKTISCLVHIWAEHIWDNTVQKFSLWLAVNSTKQRWATLLHIVHNTFPIDFTLMSHVPIKIIQRQNIYQRCLTQL